MTTHAAHPHASPTLTDTHTQHAGSCGNGHPCAPTHDQIAFRAYDIYVKTGRKSGQCKQNWDQAEKSLRDQGQVSRQPQQRNPGEFTPYSTDAR